MIVGDGPLLPVLRQRYTDCGVHFTGYLEGVNLATAYASADVFVFPSTTDTFGNAVLEAQACGLPAIVTDRGGPQEIVRRCQSGLIVNQVSPEVLSRAMLILYENDNLRRDLAARALVNARDAGWERILDEFWTPAACPGDDPGHEYRRIRLDPSGAANRSLQVA